MNLPNKLTILRIFLTAAFILFLFAGGLAGKIAALLMFLLASLTDILDGYIAKRHNQITVFGKLMDPIADKILVLSAFLAFVELGLIPAWLVVIIVFREIAVTALRGMALARGKVIASNESGKGKTVWQVGVIFIILFFLILDEGGSEIFGFWNYSAVNFYKDAIFILMCVTAILTLVSGVSYFVKNREVYSNESR
jgi:CDP-diacylglycerol--glycerol-3-phosphate 3-phosphatidyltransferase